MGSTDSSLIHNFKSHLIDPALKKGLKALAGDVSARESFAMYIKGGTWMHHIHKYDNNEGNYDSPTHEKRLADSKNVALLEYKMPLSMLARCKPLVDRATEVFHIKAASEEIHNARRRRSLHNINNRNSSQSISTTSAEECDGYINLDDVKCLNNIELLHLLMVVLYPYYRQSSDYRSWKEFSSGESEQGSLHSDSDVSLTPRSPRGDISNQQQSQQQEPAHDLHHSGLHRMLDIMRSTAASFDGDVISNILKDDSWATQMINNMEENIPFGLTIYAVNDIHVSSTSTSTSNQGSSAHGITHNAEKAVNTGDTSCRTSTMKRNTPLSRSRLLFANHALRNMIGYQSYEALHAKLLDKSIKTETETETESACSMCALLSGPKTENEYAALLNDAIQNGNAEKVGITHYRNDGTPFTHLVAVHPVYNFSGVYKYVIMAHFDIERCPLPNDIIASVNDLFLLLCPLLVRRDDEVVLGVSGRLSPIISRSSTFMGNTGSSRDRNKNYHDTTTTTTATTTTAAAAAVHDGSGDTDGVLGVCFDSKNFKLSNSLPVTASAKTSTTISVTTMPSTSSLPLNPPLPPHK